MRTRIIVFCTFCSLWACQKESPGPVIIPGTPEEVELIFPLNNSQCNEGTNITPAESTVTFEWRTAKNADEYELFVTNLFTSEESSFTTTLDTIPIVLQRATAYSWYVVARSNSVDSTSTSAVWKFYNSGEGIQSYAPFPADIISPEMAATITGSPGSIVLDWEGSDVDNDITGYDVYFGTTDPPPLFAEDVAETELVNVNIEPGIIYYWSVSTKDAYGNVSESGVYQFEVE